MSSKSSAYFPRSGDDCQASMAQSDAPEQLQAASYSVGSINVSPSGFSFPSIKSVLWSREPIAYPKTINAFDIAPALLLTARDIQLMLRDLVSNATQEHLATVVTYDQLNDEEVNAIPSSFLGSPKYLFRIQNPHNGDAMIGPESTVTIPVLSKESKSNLDFDQTATQNLILNLGRSVRSIRAFSLKSCIRVRAAGHASLTGQSNTDDHHKTTPQRASGSIRFETILPNYSFQITQVKPIPILSTPLSNQLLNYSVRTGSTFCTGFVTMNQTRKLVLVQESDPSISLIPLVGLWIRLATERDYDKGTKQLSQVLDHPYVWGSCVRFLCSDLINQRALAGGQCFLLILMVNGRAEYYEVSRVDIASTYVDDEQHSHSDVPLSNEKDFICTDFTGDLSTEFDPREDNQSANFDSKVGEIILCRFRPVAKFEHVQSFNSALRASFDSGGVNSKEELRGRVYAESSQHATTEEKSVSPSFRQKPVNYKSYSGADGANRSGGSRSGLSAPNFDGCNRSTELNPAESVNRSPRIQTNGSYVSVDRSGSEFSSLLMPRQSIPVPEVQPTSPVRTSTSSKGLGSGIANCINSCQSRETFDPILHSIHPNSIILSQQRQITELQRQVAELRNIVLSMGGKPPSPGYVSNSQSFRVSQEMQKNNDRERVSIEHATANSATVISALHDSFAEHSLGLDEDFDFDSTERSETDSVGSSEVEQPYENMEKLADIPTSSHQYEERDTTNIAPPVTKPVNMNNGNEGYDEDFSMDLSLQRSRSRGKTSALLRTSRLGHSPTVPYNNSNDMQEQATMIFESESILRIQSKYL